MQHTIIDDLASKNPGGVGISELHAITTADVDNDGIADVIAGKRLFSRQLHRSGSARRCSALPVPNRPRQTRAWRCDVRSRAGHNRSGVGSMVQTADLNKDGALEILTATDRGTFIFWSSAKKGARTK